MDYILYKNRNIAAYVPQDCIGNLIYRKKEDILIPNVISLLRATYSKEILSAQQVDLFQMIHKQKELAQRLFSILGKESESVLPFYKINLYSLMHDEMEYSILNDKIRLMITKSKNEFTELDLFLFNLLSANDFELNDLDRNIDYADFLFDPLYRYLEKLSWFEYRMAHFFHLLLSEKEVILSDYHLDFIVFFLQSYYNVFSYYNKHLFNDIRYDGIVPFIENTDKSFNNIFCFLSRYNVGDESCNFIKMARKLDYPLPINDPTKYNSRYYILPNINSGGCYRGGVCPIFVKEEKVNNILVCDYELEVMNLSYLYCFVNNFFEISLKQYDFYERDSEYGRFFLMSSFNVYNDRSRTPVETVSSFDPSQAYNINMDWNKERWDSIDRNKELSRRKHPYLY